MTAPKPTGWTFLEPPSEWDESVALFGRKGAVVRVLGHGELVSHLCACERVCRHFNPAAVPAMVKALEEIAEATEPGTPMWIAMSARAALAAARGE